MSKQVRLPEDFVKMLRNTYDGDNDMQRLENWKNDGPEDALVKLVERVEELDVSTSSQQDDSGKEWSRSEISDIAEDVVYSLMDKR